VLADAEAVPHADHSFDAVFLCFTLELFADDEIPIVLGEIARVMRPHGRLGVVAMHDDGRGAAMVDLYKFLHRHFPHVLDCRPIAVPRFLERAGFEVVASDGLSIWGLPVLAVAARPPANGCA
jgi:demethylmenaquinone methyltransferase/2-methoxy-6-polyprenyl-1,4-benzoquinol methylase